MPELPEVETMVRGLRPTMQGRTIAEATVVDPFLLQGIRAPEFQDRVGGSLVGGIQRRGKWVVMTLTPARGLIVIQPRMTGGFWLVPPDRPDHTRLTFRMEGTAKMVWFCDNRRLGKIAWYPDEEVAAAAFNRSHGPDALQIGLVDLRERLARTDRAIKPALMDQKLVAGLGNIYAEEVLHRAAVHPERTASKVKPEEVARIHKAIGEILGEAIAAEGSSFDRNYRTVLGSEGGFLGRNAVYGREGLPCPRCGVAITKVRMVGLIGRPTHFCPGCQPRKPRRLKEDAPAGKARPRRPCGG